jgi:hypothetical protein
VAALPVACCQRVIMTSTYFASGYTHGPLFRPQSAWYRCQEGIVHKLTTLRMVYDRSAHQFRLLGRMIEFILVRSSIMNFGEGESHTVEFFPGLPYQAAFFFRTYQQGSC